MQTNISNHEKDQEQTKFTIDGFKFEELSVAFTATNLTPNITYLVK